MAIRLEAPLEHEFRFAFLGGNHADDLFVQAFRDLFVLDIGDESPLVFAFCQTANCVDICAHCVLPVVAPTIATNSPLWSRILVNCNGRVRSDSVTRSKATRIAWLIILWLSFTRHEDSRSQKPASAEPHSVSA